MQETAEEPIPVLACSEIGKLHSLAFAGIPVYAGSNYDQNTALYSRFVQRRLRFSDYESEAFIEELCHFGKNQPGPVVLMTDDDQAVLAISKHRRRLQKHFLFLLPDHDMVECVHDKQKFYKKAEEQGLNIPTTHTIASSDELDAISSQLNFPCILKPVSKDSWWREEYEQVAKSQKKALRCSDVEELYQIYEQLKQFKKPVIVQELIEGPDDQHFSVNMYLDREGQVRGYYLYQKVRMCPPKAGRGSYLITVEDAKVAAEAKKVARTLGMRGLINIQFKRDETGAVKLIEIEPRLSVSSYLGVAAGANLAVQYYYNLVGEEVTTLSDYQTNVKYFDLIRDIKAFWQYRQQGELTLPEWVKSYRGNRVYNGYSLKDPLPIVMSLWFMIRSKFENSRLLS